MLPEIELRETKPAGDCVAEGGSDWRKDAGEDGGATKGREIAAAWVEFTASEALLREAVGSGTRTACPIRFLCFWNPKHQDMLQQPPHLLFCKKRV